MARSLSQLRADAECIFRAGLKAVDAHEAVLRHLRIDANTLCADDAEFSLTDFKRIFANGGVQSLGFWDSDPLEQ